ncbi:MAG TPA: hypothetical protein VG389_21805 [Myxococcota bacterium]|jgi:hypothetical protein|nr:hypothetical protein [Myxococcota bacterium]
MKPRPVTRRIPAGASLAAAGAALTMAVVTVVGLTPATAADKALLRFKFRPGEVQKYQVAQENKTSSSAGTATSSMITTTDMVTTYTVRKALPDGAAEVEWRFASVDMDGEGMGGADLKSMADAMKTMWFTVRAHPTGEVDAVEPHDVPAGMEAVSASLKSVVKAPVTFPVDPVGPGDSWKGETEIPLPMGGMGDLTMSMKYVYTLRSFKVIAGRKVAVIDMSVRIASGGGGAPGMDIAVSGDGSGVAMFDVDKGVLQSSELTSRTRTTLRAEKMSLALDTEARATMKLDSVSAAK